MVAKTNPLNDKQFERLRTSIDWSNQQLEKPKEERIKAIRQFVGYHHSANGAEKRVPVPFLKMAVGIYVRLLAPRAPRALLSTRVQDLKWTAANTELAVNQIPEEIELQATLRRLAMEALFSMGIAKCGTYKVGEMLGHAVGSSFVDVVAFDDYIVDMSAKHMDRIQYQGNEYWMDYDIVKESRWFPSKNKTDLKPDDHTIIGEAGEERAEGVTTDGSADLFKEKVKLRDIWIPSEKLLITYGVQSKKLLKVIEWDGPERGPYPILSFDNVPGSLLPLAPVSGWIDLHELSNSLFRKLGDQADSQKTVLGFQGGDDEAVTNFQKARDGGGITYGVSEPKKLQAGGIDSSTLLFYMQCKDLSSYFASNLDSLGGLSPQAETLGQDKLLSAASGAQLRDMADNVIDFSKKIFKTLTYYEWNDLVRKRRLEKPIPGSDLSIPVQWNRKSRRGKLSDYHIEVDVYSLQDDSPGLKLQKLGMIVEKFVIPFMPAIQQMGGTFDVQRFLADVAKFSDFPELNEWIQFMEQLTQPGGGNEAPGMPANTSRTYERTNRPGATEGGKNRLMQQVLAGGKPQGDEMAAMGRSTG